MPAEDPPAPPPNDGAMVDRAAGLTPGQRVRVTQQVARQGSALVTEVVGTVLRRGQSKTGSWFAHAKDDKLWLDRLEIRKDDGELYICNIDAYTRVDVLTDGGAAG